MRKVAIIRRNGLGDLILSFPLLFFIKKQHPESEITLFVDKRNAPLLPYLPKVYEKCVLFPRGNKYITLFFTALCYRKEKFDLAISAKTAPMKLMNLFLYLLGAKKRVAYVDKGSWHAALVNLPKSYDRKRNRVMHQALQGVNLYGDLATLPLELYPQITIPEEIKKRYPLPPPSPTLLISASSTLPWNRMEETKYANAVNLLHQRFSFSVMLIAEKKDAARAYKIKEKLQMEVVLHFPRNFDHFMVLLGAGTVYFVSEGGIAHIGAAMGKKMVVFFGDNNLEQWSPLSKETTILYDARGVNHISDEKIWEALCLKF